MRLWLAVLAFARRPVALAQEAPPAIAYDSVPNLLKLPDDMHLGEVAGVAVNSKGHIFVYSRGGSSTGPASATPPRSFWSSAPNGKFVREIGKNLYAWSFAHTVRIDKDDNIWATDKGSDMIVKFNPQGRVVMVFGRKPEASDAEAKPHERNLEKPLPHQDGRFRQPTDVTWGPDGTIYISDGYVNSRVAKISKDGDWIKSWGQTRQGPGRVQPRAQHRGRRQGQHLCRRPQQPAHPGVRRRRQLPARDQDRRAVRSRTPGRRSATSRTCRTICQTGGSFAPGAPWALCITPPPNQVLYSSDSYPGRIYKLSLDGKVLGVLGSSGKQLKQFGWIHEIACPSENVLFVAEILNWRVQKLILHPEKTAAASKP